MQIWEKCSRLCLYSWELKHSFGTSLSPSPLLFEAKVCTETIYISHISSKFSNKIFSSAVNEQEPFKVTTCRKKNNLWLKGSIVKGLKCSTSAASCTLFRWFSLNQPFFLQRENVLVLLLVLIHNNWRFQKHSAANSILLILWKEKHSTFYLLDHSAKQANHSLNTTLLYLGIWWFPFPISMA